VTGELNDLQSRHLAPANLLIRKHGADAELEAAKRADLMLDRGDDDGRLLWMRIRRAIETLQAPWRDWS
jgi:hypothetical protein